MKKGIFTVFLAAAIIFPEFARSEDVGEIFKKVNDLIKKENYSKAIEELSWASKELQKLNVKKIESFLPTEISGLKGKDVESSNMLGMSLLERKYSNGKDRISLTLGGRKASSAIGGLSALGSMAMMGEQHGMDTFRIDGRTAKSKADGRNAEIILFLESGSFLKLRQKAKTKEAAKELVTTLKKAVESMNIAKLDSYLKGS